MRWVSRSVDCPVTDRNDIQKLLLRNRGITEELPVTEFLTPTSPQKLNLVDIGFDKKELDNAGKLIQATLQAGKHIIVYGDYDADGICATAIMWEYLYRYTTSVSPFIPNRQTDGYGLNLATVKGLKKANPDLALLICVDHGITAATKIKAITKLGINVVVCDHHQRDAKPLPCPTVYTDRVCAAAITWFFTLYLASKLPGGQKAKFGDGLDLVAIATVADLEPLLGINRSLVKYGLEALRQTTRPGLLALFALAGLTQKAIGTYEVGFIIGPRLNATGRLGNAIESLRLVCTFDTSRAQLLAQNLSDTNQTRQDITQQSFTAAKTQVNVDALPKIIVVASEEYQEGIIGLIAGKLLDEFNRPAIAIALKPKVSKASARSIRGFDITKALKANRDLLEEVGGHPLAAGFSLKTDNIDAFIKRISQYADTNITDDLLEKTFKVDCQIPFSFVDFKLYKLVTRLAPFGIGNPDPVFVSEVMVKNLRLVGSTKKHTTLLLADPLSPNQKSLSAIYFNQSNLPCTVGQKITIAFTVYLDEWGGGSEVKIKIKDLQC